MKALFDTSVIVAFSEARHIHHRASFAAVLAHQTEAVIDTHTLAEIYATLTGKMRKPLNEALFFVQMLSDRFEIVELGLADYLTTSAACAANGISGAAIYDALHARSALKAGVDVIYTWNTKDFLRLGPEIARLVRTP